MWDGAIIAACGGARIAPLGEDMAGQTSDELLALFDTARLNARYWAIFVIMSAIIVLEFFDFGVVAFLLAVVGPAWHLTYGQSATILYSGGIGSIVGALAFGAFADAWGRKTSIVVGTFICGIGAALNGLVPNGEWLLFAALRFVVGVGLTAAVVPALTIVVELTPTRHRTVVTSLYVVFATAGGFVASLSAAVLLGAIGWRGMAMLGIGVTVAGCFAWALVPESVRWLAAKGRFAEARAEVAKQLGVPLQGVPLPTVAPTTQPRASLSELFEQPRMFFETIFIWGGAATAAYGVYLWGPTVIALLQKIPVPQAAKYFVFVTGSGIVGKIVVSFVAPLVGRRALGALWGFAGAAALAAAAFYHGFLVAGVPVMVLLLAASAFCIDGSFSNLAPLHRRELRRAPRSPLLRPRPDRKRRRQDTRTAVDRADRRHRQHRLAAGDRRRADRRLPVPCRGHGAGRAVVPAAWGRDARSGDDGRGRAAGGRCAKTRLDPGVVTGRGAGCFREPCACVRLRPAHAF
jgi:MFS transporter, putative metabolite:H+ symporter